MLEFFHFCIRGENQYLSNEFILAHPVNMFLPKPEIPKCCESWAARALLATLFIEENAAAMVAIAAEEAAEEV